MRSLPPPSREVPSIVMVVVLKLSFRLAARSWKAPSLILILYLAPVVHVLLTVAPLPLTVEVTSKLLEVPGAICVLRRRLQSWGSCGTST